MARAFKLPDLAEGIREAEIQGVPVSEGDTVEEGQTVLEVETDKAAVDVPSPYSATIEKIPVEEGDVVEVGQEVMYFSGEEEPSEGDGDGEKGREPRSSDSGTEADTEGAESSDGEESTQKNRGGEPADDERPVPASPATRRLARELEVDLREVPATGPAGRVTMSDVREYAEAGPPEHPEKEGRKPAEAAGGEAAAGAGRGAPEGSPLSPQTAPIPELPDFTRWGGTERIAMRSVRKATARRMTQAWSQIPHAWHYDNADVTEIERIRQDQKSEIDEGSLSMTVYAMKAVTAALGEHPRVNSSIDVETEEIILKQYYHIGVAVDTERGLIVPVIRDVDKKSVADLSAEFADTVKRTRSGEASLEELQGGTFTITNVGPLGGVSISPIVNFPQVAVLGMAAATWRPVVVEQNGERTVTPRLMLPLVLAYDHRVVDGADAARFVSKTVEMLEDPEKLMLAM